MKNTFRSLTLLVSASLLAPLAHATPISYTLNFDVEFLNSANDPDVQIGNRYPGFFTVDDAILASDGLNKAGDVTAFFIQMEDVIWDLLNPSEFRGFRGPDGIGSASPGFDVVGGEIVNLRGGVFGSLDIPFVDFTFVGVPNTFSTINDAGSFGGSMSVHRVPEPGTLWLAAMGLFGVVAWRRLRPVNSTRRE